MRVIMSYDLIKLTHSFLPAVDLIQIIFFSVSYVSVLKKHSFYLEVYGLKLAVVLNSTFNY